MEAAAHDALRSGSPPVARRARPVAETHGQGPRCFNVIWDEAEDLQRLAALSHPRVTIDTSGLSADATALANRLAGSIDKLSEEDIRVMLDLIEAAKDK